MTIRGDSEAGQGSQHPEHGRIRDPKDLGLSTNDVLLPPDSARKSIATTTRYAVFNAARWTILAGMLVFLLSAILALHEALNFQGRVLELAGSDHDRARRVLSVLHDTLENPGSYPEDRELPYASIAVKLDRLSRVQETLTSFDITPPSTPPTEDPPVDQQNAGTMDTGGQNPPPDRRGSAPESTSKAPMADLEVQWQSASNRLKLSIADLDDTLKTGDPARKLVEAFDLTRGNIQALAAFKGTIKVAADDTGYLPAGAAYAAEADDEFANEESRFQLQLVANELADGLAKVENRVTTSPEDELLVAHLARLKQEIGRLELFYDSTDLKIKTEKAGPIPTVWKPVDLIVEGIDHRIKEIESILLQADDGFVAATKLADLINQARTFSDHLQDMPIGEIKQRIALGKKATEGTAAVAAFETTRGDLSNAIQEIENQLDRRTRVMVVADQLARLEEEGDHGRHSRALAILREFDAVGRFEATLMPFRSFAETPGIGWMSSFGFDPQRISTLSRETLGLLFVFVIGAIGSVIYITKDSIQLVLEGNWLTDKPKRSITWYVFRPVFGVIVALAAFLLFKAGQLAMGNGGTVDGSQDFNLPILSVIALFAGLLSWQALEVIETRGAYWFRSQKRQYLWATGLENKLRIEQHSLEELASSIGRSVDQVFRWLVFRDRVSPEMQDRIADWLDTPYSQLFRNDQPRRKTVWLRVKPMDKRGLESDEFKEKLASERFHPEKLSAWLSLEQPVPANV
ncbi:MAG: hypothetical protein ACR2QJ_08815, partial [Geminicoccaceae bacterium]